MKKRISILLLTFAMLASCGGPEVPAVTTDTFTEPPVTTDAPDTGLELVLSGNAVYENGDLTAERGKRSFAITADKITYEFRVSCEMMVKASGISGIFVFSDGEDNGLYLAADYGAQTVGLYKVTDGYSEPLGRRKCTFSLDTRIPVSVEYRDGVLKAYFNENPLDTDPYPKFELDVRTYRKNTENRGIGFRMGNGISNFYGISIVELDDAEKVRTYKNPVVQGADPDVLFYNGIYYLYQRNGSGNNIFSVRTSRDLVTWTEPKVIYQKQSGDITSGFMSPNVFHYNGKFYLVFAAKHPDVGNHTLWCAVSSTPDGMFKHATGAPVPIHNDKLVAEIGGHPYVDPDTGKLYLSLVRFGGGNHIWLEE